MNDDLHLTKKAYDQIATKHFRRGIRDERNRILQEVDDLSKAGECKYTDGGCAGCGACYGDGDISLEAVKQVIYDS